MVASLRRLGSVIIQKKKVNCYRILKGHQVLEVIKFFYFDRAVPLLFDIYTNHVLKKLALDLYLRGIHNKTQFVVFTIFYHVTAISIVFIRSYLIRNRERMEYFFR